MILAYHNDAAIRAEVVARLRQHAAAGTLSFGATRWTGAGGSTLGIAVRSESCDDYAALFGYPLALAGLLDPIVAISDQGALDTAIAWHDRVLPGSDLSSVPLCILIDLLDRLGAPAWAPTHHEILIDRHRDEAMGAAAGRAAWTRLRAEIETLAESADGAVRTALHACALACWPLASSRSVLVGLVHAWSAGTVLAPNPDFDEGDRRRADGTLQGLWEATQPQREAGEAIDLPGLFRAQHPDLSRRFEADLERSNAAYVARAAQAQAIVLHHLAAAGAIQYVVTF